MSAEAAIASSPSRAGEVVPSVVEAPKIDAVEAPAGKLPRLVDEPASDHWVYGLLALAIVVGYFIALHVYWVPAHPGVDQNGYLVGGKFFASTWSTGFKPADPYSFVGRMWVEAENGRFYPKYPLGLSVIYAVAMKLGGARYGMSLAFLVSPIAMTLAVAASFLVMRMIVGSFAALVGTLLVASSPMALGLTNNPNSHATAMCFVAWGMYLLLRWWQCNGWARAIGAGLLLGAAVTVRYTEGLMLLPLVAVALMNLRWRNRRSWIEAALLGASWALPVIILATYNWFTLHHLTGYDPTNESTGFTWEYFQDNWETMLRQLYNTGLFFVLPFTVLGLVWMWRWNWRIALVLCTWTLPSLLLYTAYYWAPDGAWIGYLRFFLTILPALALAAVWMLKKLADLAAAHDGSTIVPKLAITVLVAIACGVNMNTALGEIEVEARSNLGISIGSQRIQQTCPGGSVIFAPDRLLNYLQLVGDYQLYDTQQFNRPFIQRLASIDPDQPNGLQPQRAKEMYDRLKDLTEPEIVKEQNKLMDEALARGERVFMIFPRPQVAAAMRFLPKRSYQTQSVAGWEELENARPMRRQHFGFNRQPLSPPESARPMAWQILEVTTAPPPPPPKVRLMPAPRNATTRPAKN
jgi:hypothetical protein